MIIKKFIFNMDNHYGYPEHTEGTEPNSYEGLVRSYRNADCSGYNMGEGDAEEPERDDFETDEEYEEAMNEWEETNDENASNMFSEYGNYDVFYNSYVLVYDPKYDLDIDDIVGNFASDGTTVIHEDFMQTISQEEGVSFIISIGNDGGIAIEGQYFQNDLSSGDDPFEKVAIVITDMHKKRDPKAGLIYQDIIKIHPDLDRLVSAALSPDEYKKLKEVGKGASGLRRFGIGL